MLLRRGGGQFAVCARMRPNRFLGAVIVALVPRAAAVVVIVVAAVAVSAEEEEEEEDAIERKEGKPGEYGGTLP